ncbi:MAG: GTPase Era [Burkholderiales bacterium]
MDTKSAFIAIVGSPNVGKSTLVNRIVGEKVAIVSKKPQTTRNRITGVLTEGETQLVFLDTPGIHTPKDKLGEYMVKTAYDTLRDVDAVLFVCDAEHGLGERDTGVLQQLKNCGAPVVAAVNKIDAAGREKSKGVAQSIKQAGFDSVHLISAKTGEGVEEIVKALKTYLVPGPKYYSDDAYTDQPERLIAAEIIREKALNILREEVPHGIGVSVERVSQRKDKEITDVSAVIICDRPGHKAIIIGKGGSMLKRIGIEARRDLEMLFGMKVYLELFVRVEPGWRDSRRIMHELGYE